MRVRLQFIEASMDILQFLFGGDPALWKEKDSMMEGVFADNISRPENVHIRAVVIHIYRFFFIMAKENKKVGMTLAKWLEIFFKQVSDPLAQTPSDLRVRIGNRKDVGATGTFMGWLILL